MRLTQGTLRRVRRDFVVGVLLVGLTGLVAQSLFRSAYSSQLAMLISGTLGLMGIGIATRFARQVGHRWLTSALLGIVTLLPLMLWVVFIALLWEARNRIAGLPSDLG